MTGQVLVTLRDRIPELLFATVFLCTGLACCGLAVMRRQRQVQLLIWLGIWSTIEGVRPILGSMAEVGLLPHWFQVTLPYLDIVSSYLVIVIAVLAFLQLSQGNLRLFFQGVVVVGLAVAIAGIAFFLFAGLPYKMMPYNHVLAACSVAVLATVVVVPRLSRKFLALPNRGVLAACIFLFAIEALYGNLSGPLGLPSPPDILDPMGFAVLLFSLVYAAVERLKTRSLVPTAL